MLGPNNGFAIGLRAAAATAAGEWASGMVRDRPAAVYIIDVAPVVPVAATDADAAAAACGDST